MAIKASKKSYNPFNYLLAERIKVVREELGDSQAAFSRRIGIPLRTLQNIEQAKTVRMDTNSLAKIAQTGVNIEWFITGEGVPFGQPDRGERPVEPPPPVDTDLLAQVIDGLERALKTQKLVMETDKKAELISLLYEYFLDKDKVRPTVVERFLKIAV